LDPNQDFCEEFEKMMANEFEMSMIRELGYFLGIQIKQLKNGTFVSQGKYIKDMLKKFGMNDAKAISTPMGTNGNLNSDASGNMVDQSCIAL
jgi:spore maturation protein CgeB